MEGLLLQVPLVGHQLLLLHLGLMRIGDFGATHHCVFVDEDILIWVVREGVGGRVDRCDGDVLALGCELLGEVGGNVAGDEVAM